MTLATSSTGRSDSFLVRGRRVNRVKSPCKTRFGLRDFTCLRGFLASKWFLLRGQRKLAAALDNNLRERRPVELQTPTKRRRQPTRIKVRELRQRHVHAEPVLLPL